MKNVLATALAFVRRKQDLADRLNTISSGSTFLFVASVELQNETSPFLPTGFAVHEVVWLQFVLYVVIFFDPRRPLLFVRTHLPEMLIALTWYPFSFQVDLGNLQIPYSMFHLIGVTSHAWLLSRRGRERWGEQPFFAAILCACSFILLSSALMREAEPKTFQDFPTSVYFILETLSTVGYGDLVPGSTAGRVVAVIAMFFGTGLFSAFNGFVTEWIHELVMDKKTHASEVDMRILAQDVHECKEMLKIVMAQQEEILSRLDDSARGGQP